MHRHLILMFLIQNDQVRVLFIDVSCAGRCCVFRNKQYMSRFRMIVINLTEKILS